MVLYVDASHFDQQKIIIAIKEITEGLGTVEHVEWKYACQVLGIPAAEQKCSLYN